MSHAIYLHLDKTHGDYLTIKTDCQSKHIELFPNTSLSENTKKDDLESVIKIGGVDDTWLSAQSWSGSPAILNSYNSDNHSAVVKLVTSTAWIDETEF